MGATIVASSGLDQITNHNGNTDGKYNDDSQSFYKPRKENRPFSFGDAITTATTPQLSTLPPPRKGYLGFQIEGNCAHLKQYAKSRALIKDLK